MLVISVFVLIFLLTGHLSLVMFELSAGPKNYLICEAILKNILVCRNPTDPVNLVPTQLFIYFPF